MSLEVVLLGSGTLVPDPERNSAGVAVRAGDQDLVFDLGRGVFAGMVRAGIDPYRLRRLYLSHWHPDHTCDLVPFLFARNYDDAADPSTPLTVAGPLGIRGFLDSLAIPWPWTAPRFPCEILEADDGQVLGEDPSVVAVALEHGSMPNLGYRIEYGGKAVAYTGDTGPCPALLSLARGVDILIAECSWPDHRAVPTHLSPASLGRAAREAGCRTLVVTHLYPALDPEEARAGLASEFDGEILLGHDGLTLVP